MKTGNVSINKQSWGWKGPMAFITWHLLKHFPFLTLCPSILHALYSTPAILAFPLFHQYSRSFCCINHISAAICCLVSTPNLSGLKWKLFLLMAMWALWGHLCFSLGLGGRWGLGAPPVSHPAGCGHWDMCFRMTDVRKTGDRKQNHRNTQNFRAGVTLWHPSPHTAWPKAPLTPKPEVGKGRNCTGAMVGLGGKETGNMQYPLPAGLRAFALLLLFLSRLLFHQISFLHFVQVLVQWLHHQRELFLFSPEIGTQESSHT